MPVQETSFSQQSGTSIVEVIKTYDERLAAESFHQMDEGALKLLWDSLAPGAIYDTEGIPPLGDPSGEAEAFLWDELREQARKEDREPSFFLVTVNNGSADEALYVSPDWSSTEKYAWAWLVEQPEWWHDVGIEDLGIQR